MQTYLRTGGVLNAWVGFKGDHLRVNYVFELLCRQGAELRRHHHVHLSMALEDWDVLVAARRLREQKTHSGST